MMTLVHPTPRIFVSHSHKDNDFGMKLVPDLRQVLADESTVWYDALVGSHGGGLRGGDKWWETIVEELTARSIFIVILSPDALASPWVNSEIELAWRQRNSTSKCIIPILYRPCNLEQKHLELNALKEKISFLPPRTYKACFTELLELLKTQGFSIDQQTRDAISEPESPAKTLARQFIPQIEMAFAQQNWSEVIENVDILRRGALTAMTPRLYHMLGQALHEQGDTQGAQVVFNTGLALVSDREENLTLLRDSTELLYLSDQWNAVLHLTQEALRLASDDPYWLSLQQVAQSKVREISATDVRTRSSIKTTDLVRILRKFHPKRNFYLHPMIPGDKLSSARSKCHVPNGEQILGLIETAGCILFGTKGIYYYGGTPRRGTIRYADFPSCVFTAEQSVWYGDKVDTGNGIRLNIGGRFNFPVQRLCDMLNEMKAVVQPTRTTYESQPAPPTQEVVALSTPSFHLETVKPVSVEAAVNKPQWEIVGSLLNEVQPESTKPAPANEPEASTSQATEAFPTIEPSERNKSDVPPASTLDSKGVRVLTPDLFDKFTEQARKASSLAQEEAQCSKILGQEEPLPMPEHTEEADLATPQPVVPPSISESELNQKYREGVAEKDEGNLEYAVVLWQEVLDIAPDFLDGLLAQQMDDLHAECVSQLRRSAEQMRQILQSTGEWQQEIDAWEALLEVEPNDSQAQDYLSIAQQNLKYTRLYENAQQFVEEGNLTSARSQLQLLWQHAPYYGDPSQLARRVGLKYLPIMRHPKEK